MARKNDIPDELDLDELEKQLAELDLGDEDLDLDEGDEVLGDIEGEDLDEGADDLETETDAGETVGTNGIVLDDGTEVEVSEKGLVKLKKPQILEVFAKLGFEPQKPTAKKEVLIAELLGLLPKALVEETDDVGEDADLELEVDLAEVDTPAQAQATSTPKPEVSYEPRYAVTFSPDDSDTKTLILEALAHRRRKILASSMSEEARQAAAEQLEFASQVVSLFLD